MSFRGTRLFVLCEVSASSLRPSLRLQTKVGMPLVDSTFTLALVTGQSVTDVSQNVFVNLGQDEVKLPNPVFEGDTIYSWFEVLEKRESRSLPDVGIVRVEMTGFNHEGATVITFVCTIAVYKKTAPRR